jgi:type II secretion system protein H
MHRRAGFTLIELVITMAVMAAILTLAMPALDSATPESRLNAGVRDVMATVRWLRADAIVRGESRGLEYRSGRRGLVPVAGDPADDEAQRLDPIAFPDGVRIEAVERNGERHRLHRTLAVRFDPLGTVDAHRVVLTVEGGGRRVVAVHPLTGEPAVQEVRR